LSLAVAVLLPQVETRAVAGGSLFAWLLLLVALVLLSHLVRVVPRAYRDFWVAAGYGYSIPIVSVVVLQLQYINILGVTLGKYAHGRAGCGCG
jgi:hypothetical protein